MQDKATPPYFAPKSKADRKGPPAFSSRHDITKAPEFVAVRGKLYRNYAVSYVSIETLAEIEQEPSDTGSQVEQLLGESVFEQLLSCLTSRQQRYVRLLMNGYCRRDIGRELGVSHQAVKQMMLRIKKRLREQTAIPIKL